MNMGAMPAETIWQTFDLPGADVRLAQFCDPDSAQHWFERLQSEVPWEHHRLRLFGRQVDAPRLSCWIGDADAIYTYSGTRFAPQPWTPACAELRDRLNTAYGGQFNSLLCNLYRDGRDSMGWHSDNEAELGRQPCIASLSFGASRRFRLRHRRDPELRLELELPSGSLLLMAGATQRNYRHDLPKTAVATGPRVNLTFRRIIAIVPDREDQEATIHGRPGADAIVPDREDQEAAILGRTSQKSSPAKPR
jgi:alkylated DNA repair dioxygenase AlkB